MHRPRRDEEAARGFGTLFLDRRFADAVEMLTETGRRTVVESVPEIHQAAISTPGDALEEYWWGLHGQYGPPESVAEVAVREDETTVRFDCAVGSEAAAVGLDGSDVAAFSFAPRYEPPSYAVDGAFTERPLTVPTDDLALDGILSVPADATSVPGVVLVHGAGVDDPDGTVTNSKLLRDLAQGLASEGIASLRYQKRLGVTEVDDDTFTLDTVVTDDAVAAVDRLRAVDAVRDDAVFVAGHSQGGMCAPRIADCHGGVAGVVNLDGAPQPQFPPEHADMFRYRFATDGDIDEDQRAQIEDERETHRRLVEGRFSTDETLLGRPGSWHRSLDEYDPLATAASLDCPVFTLTTFGADPEVQPELAAFFDDRHGTWQEATLPMESRVEQYSGIDHYLQSVTPPTNPLSVWFGGNVAESIIKDVSSWIRRAAER